MITPSAQLAAFIAQKNQTPTAIALLQTSAPNGAVPGVQVKLPGLLSWKITRNEDPSTDTAELTFADDKAAMFSSGNGPYSALMAPGAIDTKVLVYLGYQGALYSSPTSATPFASSALLKYTGYIQTDANAMQQFTVNKTLTLADLTNQFKFPANDTYPHVLYGNQQLSYFDPTYNLTPVNPSGGNATQWICIGKNFTTSGAAPVYGSTHVNPEVYIDTTGGSSPQNTPLSTTGYTINGTIGSCPTFTFDYENGIVTLATAVPTTSIVSLAGNPTYMAPEVIVKKLLVEVAGWNPNFLALDTSNVLLPMVKGDGRDVWTVIQVVAALTAPRLIQWTLWADENGYLRFYERPIDGPPTKIFNLGQNIFVTNYENTVRQLRTVVRADASVVLATGQDQPVTSISYDIQNLQTYGQTEPLLLDTQLLHNVRHLNQLQATAELNQYTASILEKVSRPILTVNAEIWPDPTIQPSDKVAIYDPRIGMDRQFIVKSTVEEGSQKQHKHSLVLEEFQDTINYAMGTPSGVASDGTAQASTTPTPSTTIIGAIHMGTGVGAFPFNNGAYQIDPNTNLPVMSYWNPRDGTPMYMDVYLNTPPAAAGVAYNPTQPFSYSNLPPGYGWMLTYNSSGTPVYYGVDPSNGYTTYVGPDNIFREFNHPKPITQADMNSFWTPPGNTNTATTGGTTGYPGTAGNVWVWAWWYLALNSSLGNSKFYRPVMPVNASQLGAMQTVPSSGGLWLTNQNTHGPGPFAPLHTYFYGNICVGITDYTATPPGFIGANVTGASPAVNLGCAFGAPAGQLINYVNYQKRTRGYLCVFAANGQGATQYLRVPFTLLL